MHWTGVQSSVQFRRRRGSVLPSLRDSRPVNDIRWPRFEDPFGASAGQAQRVRSLRRWITRVVKGGPRWRSARQTEPYRSIGSSRPRRRGHSDDDAVGCADWFRTGKCFMATCAPRTGGKEDVERACQRSGAKVARALLLRGKCSTGRPEHLLWPDLTERFLEIIAQRDRRSSKRCRSPPDRFPVVDPNILPLGCRPNEAHIIESQHLDNVGDPKVIRILGMKTDSARRTLGRFAVHR